MKIKHPNIAPSETSRSLTTWLLACLLLPAASLSAQAYEGQAPVSQQGGEHYGKHRGPPQEAFDACENKAGDDTCEVVTPRGNTINGICKLPPKQSELVCVPKGRMKREQ